MPLKHLQMLVVLEVQIKRAGRKAATAPAWLCRPYADSRVSDERCGSTRTDLVRRVELHSQGDLWHHRRQRQQAPVCIFCHVSVASNACLEIFGVHRGVHPPSNRPRNFPHVPCVCSLPRFPPYATQPTIDRRRARRKDCTAHMCARTPAPIRQECGTSERANVRRERSSVLRTGARSWQTQCMALARARAVRDSRRLWCDRTRSKHVGSNVIVSGMIQNVSRRILSTF